jgi:hypothetical protein
MKGGPKEVRVTFMNARDNSESILNAIKQRSGDKPK